MHPKTMSKTNTDIPAKAATSAGQRGAYAMLGMTALIVAATVWSLGKVWLNATPVEFVPAQTKPEHVFDTLKNMPPEQRDRISKDVAEQLNENPLDLTQILRLAALANVNGDQAQSEALTLQAANRSHDDGRLQASAFQIELKRKDFPAALNRIDNLFKTAPELSNELYKTLIAFVQRPESFPAVIAKLTEKPDWRVAFILQLAADKTVQAPVLYTVFSELRKAQSAETPDELRGVLARLISDKQYDKAYFMWVDSLSDLELKKAGTVFDGGFDMPITNQFFSWSIVPATNVEARTLPRAPSSTDMILRLDFSPARTPYSNVSQLVRLAPGAYRLSGEEKAESLKTSNGLVWRIYCLGDKPIMIAETPRLVGSQQWNRFSRDFTVPDKDCSQQILRLDLDAPTPLDTHIEGSASFDSIAIDAVQPDSGG